MGLPEVDIRTAVRTGDTPAKDRQQALRRPPHILITTPESFYILLTAEGSRKFLESAGTVIVDEIHAVAGDKRGAHLALSLEEHEALADFGIERLIRLPPLLVGKAEPEFEDLVGQAHQAAVPPTVSPAIFKVG